MHQRQLVVGQSYSNSTGSSVRRVISFTRENRIKYVTYRQEKGFKEGSVSTLPARRFCQWAKRPLQDIDQDFVDYCFLRLKEGKGLKIFPHNKGHVYIFPGQIASDDKSFIIACDGYATITYYGDKPLTKFTLIGHGFPAYIAGKIASLMMAICLEAGFQFHKKEQKLLS